MGCEDHTILNVKILKSPWGQESLFIQEEWEYSNVYLISGNHKYFIQSFYNHDNNDIYWKSKDSIVNIKSTTFDSITHPRISFRNKHGLYIEEITLKSNMESLVTGSVDSVHIRETNNVVLYGSFHASYVNFSDTLMVNYGNIYLSGNTDSIQINRIVRDSLILLR